VQTADRASAGAEGHIGLQGREADCVLFELALAPRAHESTSGVFMGGRLDNPRANDITFAEIHFMQLVLLSTGSSFTTPLSRSS
jgi:hypothetical protein